MNMILARANFKWQRTSLTPVLRTCPNWCWAIWKILCFLSFSILNLRCLQVGSQWRNKFPGALPPFRNTSQKDHEAENTHLLMITNKRYPQKTLWGIGPMACLAQTCGHTPYKAEPIMPRYTDKLFLICWIPCNFELWHIFDLSCGNKWETTKRCQLPMQVCRQPLLIQQLMPAIEAVDAR